MKFLNLRAAKVAADKSLLVQSAATFEILTVGGQSGVDRVPGVVNGDGVEQNPITANIAGLAKVGAPDGDYDVLKTNPDGSTERETLTWFDERAARDVVVVARDETVGLASQAGYDAARAEAARDASVEATGDYPSTDAALDDIALPDDAYFIVPAPDGDTAGIKYRKRVSPNLFNSATVRDGYAIASNGTSGVYANPGWGCSAFIAVTASQQYTISGTRGRYGAQFFSAATDGAVVAGSYNATPTLPLTLTAPAGALYLVINLYTDVAPTYSNVQVEHGASATGYMPYGEVVAEYVTSMPSKAYIDALSSNIGQVPAIVDSLESITASIGRPVSSAVTVGNTGLGVDMVFEGPVPVDSYINVVRYASTNTAAKVLQVYTLSGGTFTRIASYPLPAPVVGDNLLTRSQLGDINVPAGSYVGFRGAADGGITFSQTPTPADGAGWYIGTGISQGSFAKGTLRTNSRMQAGVELKALGDFSHALSDISGLQGDVAELQAAVGAQGLSVVIAASTITITDSINGLPLVHTIGKTSSYNSGLRFDSVTYNGASIADVRDDICPIRAANLGTVGANHGWVGVFLAPNPDGKTTADLGSTWQDTAGREYVLVKITTHPTTPLMFLGSYSGGTGGTPVSASASLPVTDLTHKANATHTGSIPVGGIVNGSATNDTTQLFPTAGRRVLSVSLNGALVSANGSYVSNEAVITESYEILDYKSIYDTAKANVGVSYATLADASIYGTVLVQNKFRYRAGGWIGITTTYDELYPIPLGICGAVQAWNLSIAGYTTTRYVPGMGTVSGFDWSAGVDLTSYASTVDLPASAERIAGQISAFSLDVLSSGGTPYFGFGMGYLPFGARSDSAGRSSQRASRASASLWNMRNTKKCYPAFTSSESAGWGHLHIDAFRTYLSPTQIAEILPRKTSAPGAWSALDTAAQIS